MTTTTATTITTTALPTSVGVLTEPAAHTVQRATTRWVPARIAGVISFTAVALCIVGALIIQLASGDLYAAMESSSPAELADLLPGVADSQTQLVIGLSVWMVAFPLIALASVLLARLGTHRTWASISTALATGSIGAFVIFLSLMMTFPVAIAPAHVAGHDVLDLGRALGFATSTMDWIVTAPAMGLAPIAAVWAGKGTWAPRWLQRLAGITMVVTVVELIALAAGNTDIAFILVPAGMVLFVSAGVAAIRHAD